MVDHRGNPKQRRGGNWDVLHGRRVATDSDKNSRDRKKWNRFLQRGLMSVVRMTSGDLENIVKDFGKDNKR